MTSPISSALSSDKPRFVGEWVRLGELVSIKTGKLDANAADEDGIYPFFTCAENTLRINTAAYDCECVLVAGNGDLNVKYYNGKFNAYQRTYIIEVLDRRVLDPFYLYQFLKSYVQTLREQSIGGVIKYIKLCNLKDALIPLPDVQIQQNIVGEFEKMDLVLEKQSDLSSHLDALVKSRFVEMFNDHCARVKLSEICDTYNGDRGKNYPSEKDRVEKGIPFVNASHLSAGKVSFENMDYITEERYALLSGGKISRDDILYCLRGSLGKCAIADFECGAIASSMMLIRPDQKKILPAFLYQALISPEVTKQLGAARNGSTQPNLSAKSVRNYLVSLPNLDSQRKFVAFTRQIDKLRFAGNHEMNFRCERFTLSWSTMA